MKTYKDINNGLWAYEIDGSQDYLIPADFILITEEEANLIRAEKQAAYEAENSTPVLSPLTKEELLAELQALSIKIEALT
jgi:hypothetical protein